MLRIVILQYYAEVFPRIFGWYRISIQASQDVSMVQCCKLCVILWGKYLLLIHTVFLGYSSRCRILQVSFPGHTDSSIIPTEFYLWFPFQIYISIYLYYLLFIFQNWLQDYCQESFKCSFFSWMAHNANLGTPVDRDTLVIMSLLLWRNLTVFIFCKEILLWKVNSEMGDDICLLYCGENCFVEAQLGT